MLIEDEDNAQLTQQIAGEFQVSEQKAGEFLQNTLIYTHGLAAIVATGVMRLLEKNFQRQILSVANISIS